MRCQANNQRINAMLRSFESKEDLADHLRGERNSVLVRWRRRGVPRKYYALDLTEKMGGQLKLGIISSFDGIDPSWIFSSDGRVLVIGHDLSVTFIDVAKHRLALVKDIDGVCSTSSFPIQITPAS
jgi:hypothetical protein